MFYLADAEWMVVGRDGNIGGEWVELRVIEFDRVRKLLQAYKAFLMVVVLIFGIGVFHLVVFQKG